MNLILSKLRANRLVENHCMKIIRILMHDCLYCASIVSSQIAKHKFFFPFLCRNASKLGKFSFRPCARCGAHKISFMSRSCTKGKSRWTTASIVRVGHAFVLVPPCDFFFDFSFKLQRRTQSICDYFGSLGRCASIWASNSPSGVVRNCFPQDVIYEYSLDEFVTPIIGYNW